MQNQFHILLLMIALPLMGAALVMLIARTGIEHVRRMVFTNVVLSFVLAMVMVLNYAPQLKDAQNQPHLTQMQSEFRWLGTVAPGGDIIGPDIRFAVGVDGISLWLVALTSLLMIPAVLVSWEAIQDRPAVFYALMLMLQAGLVGVFTAQDVILFYMFFEFTLIPLFFMIGVWGGHDRRWAARKFFIYTFAGSVLTFLGLLFIVLSHSWMADEALEAPQAAVAQGPQTGAAAARHQHMTFSIERLTREIPELVATSPASSAYWLRVSPWIFAALFAGFAIKVPLFPFHTWLPLAHVEAPTAGSVLLAGVLLKIGSYGFLRFALPLTPEACWIWFDVIAVLSVVGIIYGALLALAQDDIKKLVAYSSVSHMGFCMLGLFSLNAVGISGGLLQMLNHGLSTGALFAIVGMLYERYHTRDIEAFGGLTRKFPVMSFCLLVVVFSSIGLPGLNGFTGEVLSIMGMFSIHRGYAVFGLSGIIVGAWYLLWLVQRTFFGPLREPLAEGDRRNSTAHGGVVHAGGHAVIHDLNFREVCALAPLLVLFVVIGLFPQYFLNRMEPSVARIVRGLENRRPDGVHLSARPLADRTGVGRLARHGAAVGPSRPFPETASERTP